MNKQLPDKASDLIDLALDDLEKCEKDPRYKIDMKEWHTLYGQTCLVCLAGSVMAQTLQVQLDFTFCENRLDKNTEEKLDGLDWFRTGGIEAGLQSIFGYRETFSDIEDKALKKRITNITQYKENPSQFKQDMRRMAEFLREEGY